MNLDFREETRTMNMPSLLLSLACAAAVSGQPPAPPAAPDPGGSDSPAARPPRVPADALPPARPTAREAVRGADPAVRARAVAPWYTAHRGPGRRRQESLSEFVAFLDDPFRFRDRTLEVLLRLPGPLAPIAIGSDAIGVPESASAPVENEISGWPDGSAVPGGDTGAPPPPPEDGEPGVGEDGAMDAEPLGDIGAADPEPGEDTPDKPPTPAVPARTPAPTNSPKPGVASSPAPRVALRLPAPRPAGESSVRFINESSEVGRQVEAIRAGRPVPPPQWVTVDKREWWEAMNLQAAEVAGAARRLPDGGAAALGRALLDMSAQMEWYRAGARHGWQRAAHDTVLAWLREFAAASGAVRPAGYQPPALPGPPSGMGIHVNEAVILGFDRSILRAVASPGD